MQTTRREINSFVSRKSFKYNDVIDSKIVNLDIWCHFRFLYESSWKLKSDIDLRLISDQVRMLKLSIQVELKDCQKIDIETQLDDQSRRFTLWTLIFSYSEFFTLNSRRELFSLMINISIRFCWNHNSCICCTKNMMQKDLFWRYLLRR